MEEIALAGNASENSDINSKISGERQWHALGESNPSLQNENLSS